ncbi:MAG: flagellin lysine-N-methylase [Faecousia sp.]
MNVTKPAYYDDFHCIAGRCPDSCCKEWDVDVDEAAAARYRALSGPLGDRLRQVLLSTGDGTVMTIQDGRCPMWREDGLCRIQAELGEEALCRVCRQFPRLRHDYGGFAELGLELSCPEAARLILSAPAAPPIRFQEEGAGAGDYDDQAMDILLETRERALALLEQFPNPADALTLLLFYGCQAQAQLDGAAPEEFHPAAAQETALSLAKQPDIPGFLGFFQGLEILTDRWAELLRRPHAPALPARTTALARYLVERYWLQAVSDYDLTGRVKFILISCLLVGLLGGDYAETAQLFSKEIENDADNVDAILDAAYSVRAFADDKLLGMLQMGKGNESWCKF